MNLKKKSKAGRLFSLLLVACMLTGMFPSAAFAAGSDIVTYPVTGGNIYFDKSTGTITNCDTNVTKVEIPEIIDEVAVTTIGEQAFYGCNKLGNIVIPNSVEMIKKHAFYECSNLESITIPGSVKQIESGTFVRCENLKSAILLNGITEIGLYAFSDCSKLSKITIPNSVTYIGSGAFSGCSSLNSIVIPNSVTSPIEIDTFRNCISLQSIVISNNVTEIGAHAFSGCSNLKSITIPNSISKIGLKTFYGCDNLNDVYYTGSETQWSKISINNGNENLTNATIHYNSTGPDYTGSDPDEDPDKVEFEGHVYQVFDDSTTWEEANSLCAEKGGYLATITSEEEQDFLINLLQSHTKNFYWIGGTDSEKEGTWKWITGEEWKYENWISGQPDNHSDIDNRSEDYLALERLKKGWNDLQNAGDSSGSSKITNGGYICEWGNVQSGQNNSETSSEQGLHIYTDVPSRIVTVEDTFSVGAVMIDENGNDTDLSGITFIVEDDNILRAQDVYEKDGVLYCSFRANSAGTTRIRVRDANADREATISFTVEPVTGDAYTVNNFQDTYKNGIQIKNSRVSENSDGSYDISFDAYNSLYLYGAVEVYDADGQLQDAEYLDKWTDVAGIKDVVSYICEIALVSVGQTYWKELASAETHIDVRVPKGGYILISANPKESVVCSMLNSMDLIWQYMDYMGKLKGSLSSEKQLPKVIIQKIQEESDSFPQKWMKAFFNEAFQKSITSEAGIQDFIKGLVNVLMSNDLDQMVAGTLAETLEGSATDLFTDWFTTASGPAGIAINGIFSVSGASNTVIQTIQFCKCSEARFITVQVPDGGKRVNSDITVDCDMNDDTALSVYKIDVEESKKYLVSIADIENQNVKPGNPEDGPGYQRPVDPSSVDIWAAYDIRLVDGEDEYVPGNSVEVTLPLPEELRGYIGKVKVYRIDENGDTTVLWGVSDGTRVSVVTDHFSVYLIASTSVDQDSIKGEYNIDSLKILDSDGQALNSIPSGEFYVDADLSKSDGAGDAVLVLAAYDSDGKMLSVRCAKTSSAEEGGTVNIRMENPDGEVAEVRAFVLRSLGMPVSLCPAVSVG